MKEFLFRYRRVLISISIIIGLVLFAIAIGFITQEGNSFGRFIFSIVVVGFFIVTLLRPHENVVDYSQSPFSSISRNYIHGKRLYLIGQFVSETKKEKAVVKQIITNAFGSKNFSFYERNFSNEKITFAELDDYLDTFSRIGGTRTKLQILDYLINIYTIDRFLSIKELSFLRKVCKSLRFHYNTLDSILAMYNYQSEEELNQKAEQEKLKKYQSNALERYYKILELPLNASIEDIKEYYRRLVKLYHPDKKKGLKKQFLLVQEAYEEIKNNKVFK